MFFPSRSTTKSADRPWWRPILYSAAIFPGTGQWMQRRVAAALVYGSAGALATVLFVAMLARHGLEMVRVMRGAWTWGIDPNEVQTVVGPIVKTGGFLIAVYFANLFDTAYATYRRLRAWDALPKNGADRINPTAQNR